MAWQYYKNEKQFGYYIAGLWETGIVAVKQNAKHPKPTVIITFHKQQAPVAETLSDRISKLSKDQNCLRI